MNSRPNLTLTRAVVFPYLVHIVQLNDPETVRAPEPDWLQFRFLRRAQRPDPVHRPPTCVTCILPPNPFFPQDAEVVLDVRCEALMSAAARLLQRRVFIAPQFMDQPDDLLIALEPVASILHLVARRAPSRVAGDQVDASLVFESVIRLILLYWPNTETAEIELGSARRPPQALRQALAYIAAKRGVIGSAASVADNSGAGLRTLERLFNRWIGVGVARYSKRVRLKFLNEQQAMTNADFAPLAEVYRFSNISRLRQELSGLDWTTTADLLPQNFYRTLLNGKTPFKPVGRARARLAPIKGNANV
jgi:AraC-like DNA-binding protein